MNIHEISEKIKGVGIGEQIAFLGLILLVSLGSFYLGRIDVLPQHKDVPYVNIYTPNGELVRCAQ